MSNSKVYPLTTRPKLIDLNGEMVNFKLDFLVEAEDGSKEFQALVLTQDQLDSVNINKVEMKIAKGKISGNITANNNKYQNYFLVLRRKEGEDGPDFNATVTINIEKIDPVETDIQVGDPIASSTGASTENPTGQDRPTNQETSVPCKIPFYKKPWFWVFLGILVFVGGLFAYNYIYLKKPIPFLKTNASTLPATTPSAPTTTGKQATGVVPPAATNQISTPESDLYKQLSDIVN